MVIRTFEKVGKVLITTGNHSPYISKNTLFSDKINPPEVYPPLEDGQARQRRASIF
jgi:hypothetical protein